MSNIKKTLVALSNAMRMVDLGKYESIIYIRASVDDVDDVEAVGFLPGLDEKFAVYLHPLKDSLDVMVRRKYHRKSQESIADYEERVEASIDKMMIDYKIQAMTGLGLR